MIRIFARVGAVCVRRLACLAGAVSATLALVTPAASQHPQFRHLGVDDGLPSSWVSDIIQDHRGFMWIGTAHGVTRYDGHRFRTYGHERANPHSLPLSMVDQVYEDRSGTLWVVTAAGLSRYRPELDGFETYMDRPHAIGRSVPASDRLITTVLEDGRGTFWVGTSTGLYRFDRRTGVATPFALTAADGRTASPNVQVIYEDRQARVWVGTHAGLYRLDADRSSHLYAPDPTDARSLPDTVVRSLAEDATGALWIGTGYGGVAHFDEGTGQFTSFRHHAADTTSVAKDRIVKLAANRSGPGIWVGTENGGLDLLDPSTGRFTHNRFDPNSATGISSNSIWALCQDATGVLWVGTFSGGVDISTPNGVAIRHFRPIPSDSTSLSYNAVPSFTESHDGRIWVATDGGGLNAFDPRTGHFTRYTTQNTNLNADAVLSVVETARGEVWVATWGGGISRFDERRRRFTSYATTNSNIPDDNVYEVLEDRAGQLWIGTDNGTVAMFDRARRRFTRRYAIVPPGLAASSVLLMRELRDGRFAVGLREGGVTVLDPATGAQTHYVAGEVAGIASNIVHALQESEPGVLWVGTDNGLDRLELSTGRCTHYGERDGLPSTVVDGIEPDAEGRLWLSTDRGISRFDLRRHTFKTYDRSDGLQGNEFLMRSSLRAHDGTLYFGSNNGFNAIHPEQVVENLRRPPVVLTGLQLFNRPVVVGAPGSPLRREIGEMNAITLTHAQNVITFEFAALDYTAPDKAQYAYRMEGFDAGWQNVGHQHSASYTNLAPGRYTFRVKASNGDGVWNEEGTSIDLVITPPLWATWWFRLLAAVLGVAGLIRFFRFQQQRRVEVALSRQALRDPLTGLANRALFRDRVAHALARLAREGVARGHDEPRLAVLFLDLDNFKTVNDSLGHHAGDRLLQAVAARLLNATRGCDTVARLGGDEFAVLLENARGAADAHTVAERIAAALRLPVAVCDGTEASTVGGSSAGAREALVAASVGIAFAEPALDADALLRNADAAMYQAKAEGKGRHAVFDPALVAAAEERLELESGLAQALGRGEFALVYQPIVCLTSGAVTSAEALIRWHHPTRGLVNPLRFVPLAEASGLIVEIGRWVLEEACRAAAGWPPNDSGAPVAVTVNVSGRQLLDPALPGHVAGALAAAGLAASRLTLEITESVLMQDTGAALVTLRALKTLGVRLAIDDFGTGYSSLRYLQQFPVDVLKIDKSFVDGVARDGPDAALARTIVALGDMLSLRTVAEGVEDDTQRERLRAMGCEFGQGYLFARPLDAGAMLALLTGPSAAHAPDYEACLPP